MTYNPSRKDVQKLMLRKDIYAKKRLQDSILLVYGSYQPLRESYVIISSTVNYEE